MRIPYCIRRGWSFSPYIIAVSIITLCIFSFLGAFGDTVSAQDSTVSISGTVKYAQSDVPVDSTVLILSDGASDTTFTDADGYYQFAGLQAGLDYSLTPSGEKDDVSVTAYDAAFILQLLCNLTTFDRYDSIAADVTCNSTEPFNYAITAYDAAVLLRHVVGYEVESCIGDWIFEYHGEDATQWHMYSLFWSNMDQSHVTEDWKAIIIGDVSGNWRQPVVTTDTVAVWLTDKFVLPGENFRVCINVGNVEGLNVFSAQFAITYDDSNVSITEVSNEETIYEHLGVLTYRVDGGEVTMAWAGNSPPEENGMLAYIVFQALPDAQIGQSWPLNFEYFMFNEGDPWAETTDGMITIVSAPDIAVSDTIHDFRQAIFGSTKDWILTISNVGIEDLIVFALLTDTTAFGVDRASFRVPPDCSEDVHVTFTPMIEGLYSGTLTVISNDPDEREVLISLHGSGAVPYQAFEVYPQTYDFGEVAVGGSARKVFTVTNVGTEEYTVEEITSSSGDFTVDKTSFTLQPDSSEEVFVTCSPADVGPTWGNIVLYSLAPDVPIAAIVSVQAEGVLPDVWVRVVDVVGDPGSSRERVSIFLENEVEVGGLQLILNFYPVVLTAIDFSSTSRSGHMDIIGVNLDYALDQVKLVITGIGQSIVGGTGSVGDFFFDVDSQAPTGAYPLTLMDVKVADIRGNQLPTGIESRYFYVGSQNFISGTVTYTDTDVQLENVELHLSGFLSETMYTDETGFYAFPSLVEGKDYCITPQNMEIPQHVITSFDASLILRLIVCEYGGGDRDFYIDSLMADVSGSGNVTFFDAHLIARYMVGDEVFHSIGQWTFVPNTLCYSNFSAYQTDQDFQAFIWGDVNRNWPGLRDTIGPPEVALVLPDTVGSPGRTLEFPVLVDVLNDTSLKFLDIYSIDLEFAYDPTVLTITEVTLANPVDEPFGLFVYRIDAEGGSVHVSVVSAEPIDQCSESYAPLLWLQCQVNPTATSDDTSIISVEHLLFNEGQPQGSFQDGLVRVVGITETSEGDRTHVLPNEFALFQNYPNPFNVNTDIKYQIVDDGYPVHTTLRIYNVMGQEVRMLLDESQETGYYSVFWDGENGQGEVVPSGVYFYRLQAGDYSQTKKMVMLR
ncbi:MAG: choice-of-anchor D domain-containing protein [Gemmatimonadota bacterium]|nr:MAG: choice-of-anchor D domain-containing protein [Gemmatimonadota bacterium]